MTKLLRYSLALGVAAVGLAISSCTGSIEPSVTPSPSPSSADPACAAYVSYGDLSGTAISVYSPVSRPQDQYFVDAFAQFEACTGADVQYEGAKNFETQLRAKLEAASPPDVAFIPQPGLLSWLVERYPGQIFPVTGQALTNLKENYPQEWIEYVQVGQTAYAVPVGASVKSLVWYSPKAFSDRGYSVPTSWEGLIALTEQIAKDNPGAKPWCLGVEAGAVTGWPLTDWLEDLLLRTQGTEVYDSWVNHQIPANDPVVVSALDQVGVLLRNDAYIAAARSVATTSVEEAGLPLLTQGCFMYRIGSNYASNWPAKVNVDPNGDVYAFPLPGTADEAPPVLIGGEFAAAFSQRREVAAFQAYLASPEFSNAMIQAASRGWISANQKLDRSLLSSPLDNYSYELLTQGAPTRFDGSDLMPQQVGTVALPSALTDWISGARTSEQVLGKVENSWGNQ